MTEQKVKKSGIAKKLKKGILAPCIKGTKIKDCHTKDKHDLDNIDNGTLSFDSSKYLKKKNSVVDNTKRNFDTISSRHSSVRTESPLVSEAETPESYLKRKQESQKQKTENQKDKGKEKVESCENSEINDVESSDSDDDVPLSICISKKKETPVLPPKDEVLSKIDNNESKPNQIKEESADSIPTPIETKHEENKNLEHTETEASKPSIPMVENPSSEYIVEEIVTEEIINGKKRITTQTITRKASPNMKNLSENPPLKMPVAIGSKTEKIDIPAKMTPTQTETTILSEGIVEMPMALPQPTSINTNNIQTSSVPNLVESEMESPLSKIVDDNDEPQNAIPMPSIPVVTGIKQNDNQQNNISENIVNSQKMAEEQIQKPILNTQSVEPGFNFNINQNNIIPMETGFNLNVCNENNMPMPIAMPMPVNNTNNNNVSLVTPDVPNIESNDVEVMITAQQKGYLNIPQPLPPSAFEEDVIEDNRSDISHGSRKKIVHSPKVLTSDEEIEFRKELENKEKIEHEEAIKNEQPLEPIPMPKTPSTYFKNNNVSDNEESKSSEEIITVQKSDVVLETGNTGNVENKKSYENKKNNS